MLNSNQAHEVKKIALTGGSESEILRHTNGVQVEKTKVEKSYLGTVIYEENTDPQAINGPSKIYGSPEIKSCLIGLPPLTTPPLTKTVRIFPAAKIVGWRSLVGPWGFFSTSRSFLSGDLNGFLSSLHEGFAPLESESILHLATQHEKIKLNGIGVFLSAIESGNYGSTLIRMLPKLLLLRETGIHPKWIITPDKSSFVLEMLDFFGYGNIPIISTRESIGVEFSSIITIDDFDNEGVFDNITKARVDSFTKSDSHERGRLLYVSRRLSSMTRPNYRPLTNEEEIEGCARSFGLKVVHPELLRFAEQVSVFSEASVVCGPSGSGMINSIFSKAGAQILDLESYTETVRQHAKLYGSLGHSYRFSFGQFTLPESTRGSPITAAWTLDRGQFIASLEETVASMR